MKEWHKVVLFFGAGYGAALFLRHMVTRYTVRGGATKSFYRLEPAVNELFAQSSQTWWRYDLYEKKPFQNEVVIATVDEKEATYMTPAVAALYAPLLPEEAA